MQGHKNIIGKVESAGNLFHDVFYLLKEKYYYLNQSYH